MTYKVFGWTLSLTQSINQFQHIQSSDIGTVVCDLTMWKHGH